MNDYVTQNSVDPTHNSYFTRSHWDIHTSFFGVWGEQFKKRLWQFLNNWTYLCLIN